MIALLGLLQAIIISATAVTVYDVTSFGADCTGHKPSTIAIQEAINNASSNQGGIVLFPEGQYSTGPIELKSGVTLNLADGVNVKFLDDPTLYPPIHVRLPDGKHRSVQFTPLIRAFGQKNVSIKGKGVLDGQGPIWWKRLPAPATRPIFINFFDCENIDIHEVKIRNSPMFNLNIVDSRGISIKGITIKNPSTYVGRGPNTDGINCSSCKRLHISNVTVTTGDDCIALNAGGSWKTLVHTEDVLIENSKMLGGHAGVSIGSVTKGGLKNVTVRNCFFKNTIRGVRIKTNRARGGIIEKIYVHDIKMKDIQMEAISITTLYGSKDKHVSPKPVNDTTPFIRNLVFENIRGNCHKNSVLIVGLPESFVKDVTISNFTVKSKLDVDISHARNIFINGKKRA